ncbi:hypothetical protein GCM10010448_30060 [Streptomyces glomeratus]|uniref:SCP domain-containing protein n=1 Tax=Streptomyces glomeratus TaxID=284452 RepID=A0ABP6LMH2_9ACTN
MRVRVEPAFTEAGWACVADRRSGDPYRTALWARPFTPAGPARTVTEVLALTNAERAGAGLPALAADPPLAAAAQAHSAGMVARALHPHTSPDGREPWDRVAAAGSRRRGRERTSPADSWGPPSPTWGSVSRAAAGPGSYWTHLFGG